MRLSGFPAWLVWMGVHLTFLVGWGNRFTTVLRWARWLGGRTRTERVFSFARTGGDLSAPAAVPRMMQPTPFPEASPSSGEERT